MGQPGLEPSTIPVNHSHRVINYPLDVHDQTFQITCVSMGNPHAVIVVEDIETFPVEFYGPLIEHDRLFPKKTNVEFIHVLDRNTIKMRVWERGAGETLACGTGASAATVAANLLGLAERKVTVHLRGGNLHIEWFPEQNNHIYMTGPAEEVFEGVIKL
jgi:diaminopimelate epimerase